MADELLDTPAAERPDGLEILDDDAQDEVEAQNEEIDRGLDALDAAIALLILLFFRRVKTIIVESNDSKPPSEPFTLDQSQTIAGEIEDALTEAGLAAVVTQYAEMFEPVAAGAVTVAQTLGASVEAAGGTIAVEGAGTLTALGGLDPKALQAMAAESIERFEANLRNTLLSRVNSLLNSAAVTGMPVSEVLKQLTSVQQAVTSGPFVREADQELTRFARTVALAKGLDEGFDVFLFIGPVPGACVRCLSLLYWNGHGVQAAFYLDEVQAITAGVDPKITDPIWAGLHPNCRHWWVGVPDATLREAGFRFRDDVGKLGKEAVDAETARAVAQAKATIAEMRKKK